MSEVLQECTGFQWDKGNSGKNWIGHQVTDAESEQIFFNKPLIVADDPKHSQTEKRWYVLGRTDGSRLLFVVFTIRKNLIRVISAKKKHTMNKPKKIPKFKNEEEERKFWARQDSTEYIDWNKGKPVSFSKLKPSTKTISSCGALIAIGKSKSYTHYIFCCQNKIIQHKAFEKEE